MITRELLDKNYEKLKDPECKEKVLSFVDTNPDVKDFGLIYVKRLTKVISHILKEDPECLDCNLERILKYNIQIK